MRDKCTQEGQAMLPDHGTVHGSVDDKKMAFQVIHIIFQIGFRITFFIFLWPVHVPFTVHHLIIFPVGYRSAGNCRPENARIFQHHGDGHKTTVAPAMHSNIGSIHPGQGLNETDTTHLIFHLIIPQMVVYATFKIKSSAGSTPVIQGKAHIPLSGHIVLPHTRLSQPRICHQLRMRATVNIYHDRIFLRRIKIDRFYQPIIQFRTISVSRQRVNDHPSQPPVFPWVLRLQQASDGLTGFTHNLNDPGCVQIGITVNQVFSVGRKTAGVHTMNFRQTNFFTCFYIEPVDMTLQGTHFRRDIIKECIIFRKTQYAGNIIISGGKFS